jgi:hypothetical protein
MNVLNQRWVQIPEGYVYSPNIQPFVICPISQSPVCQIQALGQECGQK